MNTFSWRNSEQERYVPDYLVTLQLGQSAEMENTFIKMQSDMEETLTESQLSTLSALQLCSMAGVDTLWGFFLQRFQIALSSSARSYPGGLISESHCH